ncbi:MAG: hypothetical protein PX634_15945 [Microcystis sp. M53600_WE12]|nr:hypothetical protein [Microcystis sp. M53600_WE12]
MSIISYLERTNQLSLLPDKDLVDLCPPIEPYQVTKNQPNLVPPAKKLVKAVYRCLKPCVQGLQLTSFKKSNSSCFFSSVNIEEV